jgi:biopolymer transport protein ExbD
MKLETRLKYKRTPVSTTGLLGVFFLVLFFFLISTSLNFQKGLLASLPEVTTGELVAADKLSVAIVNHEGTYLVYFNNEPVKWDLLEERLVESVQARTREEKIDGHTRERRPVISLTGDQTVPYSYIVRVLDMARKMNVEINLVTATLGKDINPKKP